MDSQSKNSTKQESNREQMTKKRLVLKTEHSLLIVLPLSVSSSLIWAKCCCLTSNFNHFVIEISPEAAHIHLLYLHIFTHGDTGAHTHSCTHQYKTSSGTLSSSFPLLFDVEIKAGFCTELPSSLSTSPLSFTSPLFYFIPRYLYK